MKVKLITTYAGPKGAFAAGSVIDVSDAEARALVDGRYAELLKTDVMEPTQEPDIETASFEQPEKAVTRGKGKRRG